MLKIKKDDQIIVIAGKDKGKMGKVLRVIPKDQRAIVENINTNKKAQRRTQKSPQGGFIDIEVPIHLSNIMLIDKKNNKPARFGAKILKDGAKVRISRKSQEAI